MENGVVNLARHLDGEFRFHVACLSRSGPFAERLPPSASVHAFGKPEGFHPATAFRLVALARQIRPALIHTHNLGALIYAAPAAFGCRAPILHGEHAITPPVQNGTRRRIQESLLYRLCAAVHAVSQEHADAIRAAHPSHPRVLALVNGVDTARFSPGDRAAARASLGLDPGGFWIAMVGRFGALKHHCRMLEAFSRIGAARPDVRLLFAGDGGPEKRAVMAAIADHPFRDRIHPLGFLRDPVPCYRAADLLAVPSENEGMSNAVLEALASGTPIVAHAACGHTEILGGTRAGILADLCTPESLAAALLEAASDPVRLARWAALGRARVESAFSIEAMAERYRALYRQLIAEADGTPYFR